MRRPIEIDIFQIDLHAEELHNSVAAGIAIQSDILTATKLLVDEIKKDKWQYGDRNEWWTQLRKSSEKNETAVKVSPLQILVIILLIHRKYEGFLIATISELLNSLHKNNPIRIQR